MDNANDLIKNYYSLNDLLKVIKVTKSPVLVSVPATLKKKHIQQEIVEYKPVTRSQMKLESIAPPKKSINSRKKRPNTDVLIEEQMRVQKLHSINRIIIIDVVTK